MTAKDIQLSILSETSIKTTVSFIKKGSMKGYIRIRPMFQNGSYPSYPTELIKNLKEKLKGFDYGDYPLFCSTSDIHVFDIIDDRVVMKKESKPKPLDPDKITKGWGSKNSQMRLDKATARNAVKMAKGNTARYY